ncbi:MAG: PmoA family protein, partial [Phycisphaerales bacterium]
MKDSRNELPILIAILTIFTAPAVSSMAGQHPINISETDQGFLITEGSDNVMVYQRKHKSLDGKYTRANYIHPLYGLDGQVLTEDFPRDHPHHRGVFWAWHQLWLSDMK